MEEKGMKIKYVIHQHQTQPPNSKNSNKTATRNGELNQLILTVSHKQKDFFSFFSSGIWKKKKTLEITYGSWILETQVR